MVNLLSASRRPTCDAGGTPGTNPASCSGVWSASGTTMMQRSPLPSSNPSPVTSPKAGHLTVCIFLLLFLSNPSSAPPVRPTSRPIPGAETRASRVPKDVRQPLPVGLDGKFIRLGGGEITLPVARSLRRRFVDLPQEEPVDTRDQFAGDIAAHSQGLRPWQGGPGSSAANAQPPKPKRRIIPAKFVVRRRMKEPRDRYRVVDQGDPETKRRGGRTQGGGRGIEHPEDPKSRLEFSNVILYILNLIRSKRGGG